MTSFLFQHSEYTPSTYSDIVFRGAQVVPYLTLPEALINLNLALEQRSGPTYYFLYFDKVDTMSHSYGPSSPQVEAEIDTLLTILERQLLMPLSNANHRGKTLLLVTADHGQMEVNPETTVYLNLEPAVTEVQAYFRRSCSGELLVPAGSPRDMFLYIEENALADVQRHLAQRLAGLADVMQTNTLLELGYFGPPPFSPRLLERLGNLVILPYAGESVWWYEKGKYSMTSYGYHGGLTPQEAEIPLLMLEFG